MTAPTLWYVNGLKTLMNAGLGIAPVTGTPKMMFLSAAYVLDQDNHDYVNDVSANEVTGTGVVAGGVTLSGVTVVTDASTNRANLKHDPITGINVTGCYGVYYVDTGTPATSPLLAIVDFSDGTGVDEVITSSTPPTDGTAFLAAT